MSYVRNIQLAREEGFYGGSPRIEELPVYGGFIAERLIEIPPRLPYDPLCMGYVGEMTGAYPYLIILSAETHGRA